MDEGRLVITSRLFITVIFPGRLIATLTLDELLQFVCEGSIDMPVIAEAEIEDRSKGDGLSEGIALLQLTCWTRETHGYG
ncbi:hypothetical protein DFJ58DRAFT_164711 [Suillus subalutaceus]|uniref:uncharacterized protein n=1 Tax=Suillus subalutaceus TaxID=48586 RepID=UPI001B8829DD|nr:uncharacterized protein DFJ58DRAFT_164711 [Suillus subalutaceus]KAG1865462.1 hypothetical protein DFJ58DRAFT_164711 [Suillus subalutaceus]